jgi:hypothetical protein
MKDSASGMKFPASKDEIVSFARQQHLPTEVISQLEKIPDKKYDSLGEMIAAAARGAM